MKDKEKAIIRHLRKGKRVNISEIARQLDLPTSTVADRIKRIDDRYIKKRSSILDFSSIGYQHNLFLAVKLHKDQKKDFLNFLKEQNCVNSIFHVNSGYNFLIELVWKDILEATDWLQELNIRFQLETLSFQILKTEEKERFIP